MATSLAFRLISSVLVISFCSCGRGENTGYSPEFSRTILSDEHTYKFAVHPLYNPERLYEIFNPIMNYMNRKLSGVKLVLEASRDYGAFEDKLYKGEYSFALPNPYQTIRAMKNGYRVFGKMGDDHKFTGIILLRKDSGIRSFSDLKGKTVSYPSATALAACMMPQYFLKRNGLDVMKDVSNIYVGSQESSIMSVYLKNSDAGVTWPVPWAAFRKTYPERAAKLFVKWETESLINNSLMARTDLKPELVTMVGEILFNLQNTGEGKELLKAVEISRFERADNATYRKVSDFLDIFSREIREIK